MQVPQCNQGKTLEKRKFNGISKAFEELWTFFFFILIRFALWAKGKSNSSISRKFCLSWILFAFGFRICGGKAAKGKKKFVVFIFNLWDAWQHFIHSWLFVMIEWEIRASTDVSNSSYHCVVSSLIWFMRFNSNRRPHTILHLRTRKINVLYTRINKRETLRSFFFQMSQQISSKLIPSSLLHLFK